MHAGRLARTCALLAALALSVPGAVEAHPQGRSTAPATVHASPSRKAVLRRIVRGLVAAGAPGAIAVVRTPIAIRRAAGGLAGRQPRIGMRATDRFRVASVTKTFVATVVLQLVAEGKLRLDDTVERWLPGLVPGGGAITLRELLNHTSGLFDYTDDEALDGELVAEPRRTWLPTELVAAAVAHPPLFPPGTRWSYSNTNYVLLGLVVEVVTGMPVGQQLEARIFRPFGLGATSFPATADTEGPFVHGYVGRATLPVPRGTLVDITSLLSPTWLWAAGAMVSNGDDITSFYAALLGGRLLRPDLLRAMRTLAPASNYGLGLWRFGTPCGTAYGHIGDFSGWRTVVYARSNGRRVAVVMVNIDITHVSWARLEIAAATAVCSG